MRKIIALSSLLALGALGMACGDAAPANNATNKPANTAPANVTAPANTTAPTNANSKMADDKMAGNKMADNKMADNKMANSNAKP